MQFRNEKLFVKVGVTVNLSPGQPKINRRSQFFNHVSDICQVRLIFCYEQLKLWIANH